MIKSKANILKKGFGSFEQHNNEQVATFKQEGFFKNIQPHITM